ncbi:MAG: hypothetical protein GXO28_03410 [Methanopyri archaeon]|nr:hypothetical protein [Methanopyri archaeon]
MEVTVALITLLAGQQLPPVPQPPIVPTGPAAPHPHVHRSTGPEPGIAGLVGGLEIASIGFGLETLLQGAALRGDPVAASVASEADVLGWAGLSVATGSLLGLRPDVVEEYASVYTAGLVYGAYVSFLQTTFLRYLTGEDVYPLARAFYEATGPSQAPWLAAEIVEGLTGKRESRALAGAVSTLASFAVSTEVLAEAAGLDGEIPDLADIAAYLVDTYGPLGLLALPLVLGAEAAVWTVTSALTVLGEATLFTFWTAVTCGRSAVEAWVSLHPGRFRELGSWVVRAALELGGATLRAFRI